MSWHPPTLALARPGGYGFSMKGRNAWFFAGQKKVRKTDATSRVVDEHWWVPFLAEACVQQHAKTLVDLLWTLAFNHLHMQSLVVFHVWNLRIWNYLTMITAFNTGSNSPLFSLDRSFRSSTSILQLSTMQQEDSSSKEAAYWDVRIVGWLIMVDGFLNGLVVWWGCWDCILVPYFPFLVGGRKGCFGKEPLSEFETACRVLLLVTCYDQRYEPQNIPMIPCHPSSSRKARIIGNMTIPPKKLSETFGIWWSCCCLGSVFGPKMEEPTPQFRSSFFW